MGTLDDFFLGKGRETRDINASLRRDFVNSRVLGLTEKGIFLEGVDTRASTLGAATALKRTTGSIPDGFFTQAGGRKLIPFGADSGKATFDKLTSAGVNKGSKSSDLFRVLNGSTAQGGFQRGQGINPSTGKTESQLQTFLKKLLNGNPSNRNQPFGSVANSNASGSGRSGATNGFGNPTETFLDGIGLINQNQNNNDFSTIGNVLNDIGGNNNQPLLSGYLY